MITYWYIDPENTEKLSLLQQLTVLSMFGSKVKILMAYGITVMNTVAGWVFLHYLKQALKEIEFAPLEEDYGDYEVSKSTIMLHNVPSTISVVDANSMISQIFQTKYHDSLESVHTVGKYDKLQLDKYYMMLDQIKEII